MKFIFSDTHTYRIKIKSLSKPQLDSANYILFAPMVNLFRGAELRWIFFANHIRYYPGSSRVSNQSVMDRNHFSSRLTYTKLWSLDPEVSDLVTSHSKLLHWFYMLTLYSLLLFTFLCAVLGTTCTCIYLYIIWFSKNGLTKVILRQWRCKID